ncbi:MAG TPA: protein kinase [Vicinamibacterales bacterium]
MTAPNSDPFVGRTIGQYEILARIGGGGMGVVYSARDRKLGRTVALKFLPPLWSHDETAKQRFLREAQAASATNHPSICTIHDIETADDGQLFIVMAYYEGQTLKKRLESGPLPVDEALDIATQIADGLAKAHAQSVVHRDIKPSNVMVTEDGVRILDFGLATFADALQLTAENTPLGTAAYMAPEQVRGRPADTRSDVWAAGVVLYEMLTGHPPFHGSHAEAVAYAIRNESPALIRGERAEVPEEVEQLVFRALHKDPAVRYQSGRELARALRQVRGLSVPVDLRTTPITIPDQTSQHQTSYRRRVWTALAVGVVVITAVWSLWPIERVPVTVVPVVNLTGYQELNAFRFALTQELERELEGVGSIRVFPHDRLLEIVSRFRADNGDPSNREAMQAIAMQSGARVLIVPTLFRDRDAWKARLEFRDPVTGVAEQYETAPVTSVFMTEKVYGFMPVLAGEVADHFASGLWGRGKRMVRRLIGWQPELPKTRMKTLEAAADFEKGMQAYEQYEFSTAREAFAAAAARDSSNPLPLAWQSRAAALLRRDKEAVDAAAQGLRLLTDDVDDRDRLLVEAISAEARRDVAAAKTRYQTLVSRYPDEARWLIEQAGFEDRQGRLEQAVSTYHAAIALDATQVRPHVELCRLYVPTRLNEPVLAKQHGERALTMYKSLGHRSGQAQALWCLVDVLRRGTVEDRREAKGHADAAFTIMQQLGYPYGLGRAYNYLAFIAWADNNSAEAAAQWEKALTLARQVGSVLLESRVLMNLGAAHESLGHRELALKRYRESFEMFEAMGSEQDAASSQANAAALQIQFGSDPEQGLRDAQNALAVLHNAGDKNFEVFARLHIAAFYRNTARWEEAGHELAVADTLSTQNNLASKKTRVDIDMGRLSFERGAYAEAIQHFTHALANSPDNDRVQVWIGMGRTHTRVGDFDTARADLQMASQEIEQQRDSNNQASLLSALGELAYESGHVDEARSHFRRAAAFWTPPFADPASLEARAYLGFIDAGNRPSGRILLLDTLAQARQMRRVTLEARCQLFLLRLSMLRQRFDEAAATLREISPAFEGLLAAELRAQLHFWRGKALRHRTDVRAADAEDAAAAQSIAELLRLVPEMSRDRVLLRSDLRLIQ